MWATFVTAPPGLGGQTERAIDALFILLAAIAPTKTSFQRFVVAFRSVGIPKRENVAFGAAFTPIPQLPSARKRSKCSGRIIISQSAEIAFLRTGI
jgi:hypothetical protein